MTIELICIGKLKEKFFAEAVLEYSKRLSKFCRLVITQLPETRLEGSSRAQEEAVINSESRAIEAKLRPSNDSYIIALAVKGEALSSEALAERVQALQVSGKSRLVFVIGGSLGLSEELMKKCDMRLSFSEMTFPHQLMRVILLEQIYRAFKINAGETYHK